MQRFRWGRPSHALVIAVLALVVACGGTAAASGPVAFIGKTLGLNGKQRRQVTSIADAQITAKAPTLSVLNATSATNATNATNAFNAANATNATNAANATNALNATNASDLGGRPASAYEPSIHWALISGFTGAIEAQSGGITITDEPATGDFYLDMGSPTVGRAILTSPNDEDGSRFEVIEAEPCPANGANCSASGDPSGNVNDGQHLYVQVYDDGTLTNDSFYIAVIG
jgi:hypothetical protein